MKRVADDVPHVGRALGVQRAQAQPVQEQPRPGLPGQRAPAVVDRAKQRARGVGAVLGLDQQRQPARQVRILHGHGGDVAVVQVLDRGDCAGVDPAGAGRRDDDQHRALEAADTLKLGQGQRDALPYRLGRVQADVDAHRVARRAAGDRGDVLATRPGGDVAPAMAAEVAPGDERLRAAGAVSLSRCVDAVLDQGVELLEGRIECVDHPARQDPVGDRPEQRHRQADRDEGRQPHRHDTAEPACDRPRDPREQPGDDQQHAEHRDRDQADRERPAGLDRGQVHQRAHRVLPLGGLDQEGDGHADAQQAQHAVDQPAQAAAGRRQFEPAPQPASADADAVARRQCQPREQTLQREGARQQAGRQRGRKEQRAQDQTGGRQRAQKLLGRGPQAEGKRKQGGHRSKGWPRRRLGGSRARVPQAGGVYGSDGRQGWPAAAMMAR